jgi:hypothetical protein
VWRPRPEFNEGTPWKIAPNEGVTAISPRRTNLRSGDCPARSWRDYRSCSDEETMVASGVKRYPMMRWVSVLISTVTLLAAALRYVSLNPVRARLVARAQDWCWSSTRAHLTGKDDGITARAPIHQRFPRFADLLAWNPA